MPQKTIWIFKICGFNVSSSFFYSVVMVVVGRIDIIPAFISLYSIWILSVVLDIVQMQDMGLG